jgi:hypothetical protein
METMFIEKWKDTAFGSDYGGDFQHFLEKIPKDRLTLEDVYERCDLKKYFNRPDLLDQKTDNNVLLENPDFEQFVHYEDVVIALTAIVIESALNGTADLANAYGSKMLTFETTREELVTLYQALADIHRNPDKFVLFEMLDGDGRAETLADISEMIAQLENCIARKGS